MELAAQGGSQLRELSPTFPDVGSLYSGLVRLAAGDVAAARPELEAGIASVRLLYESSAPSVLVTLAVADLAVSDPSAARCHLEEAQFLAAESGVGFFMPGGEPSFGFALLAREEGDWTGAADFLHDSVRACHDKGMLPVVLDGLEALAGVMANVGYVEHAVRLFAAAERGRDETGLVRWRLYEDRHAADLALARDALGEEGFAAGWAEGSGLSLDDAVAYAGRGRGERKRPSSGWASLTPAERGVVSLVAQGLSNPAIGERLFISKRTVQAHLTRVFAKVGVVSRAELAAEATRRGA
jgi:DNA-binding CsgD family transcriptional regulator